MKPGWIVVLCAAAIVAASFSLAFLEGANAAQRDAAQARAVPSLTESKNRSKLLFGRISFTRTGFHFARKCSSEHLAER